MFLGSGSLRHLQLGPLVTLRDLTQMYPYHDEIYRITVTGAQLKGMISYLFRPEALESDHSEFYQFSRGVKVVVSLEQKKILELTFDGQPIPDDRKYRIGLQGYHFKNMKDIFGITEEEVGKSKILATNAMDVLDETLSHTELVVCPTDLRWITLH